jgi:hypothetical protein
MSDSKLPSSYRSGPLDEVAEAMAVVLELEATGDRAEADQLLAVQAARVLRLLGQGYRLSNPLRNLMAERVLQLAHRSRSALWIDWILELFLLTCTPPNEGLVMVLDAHQEVLAKTDMTLLAQYVDALNEGSWLVTDADIARANHLARLLQRQLESLGGPLASDSTSPRL